MAFGGFKRGPEGSQPMSEINMIPLIDVMLVLLVIFIVTAPLLTHAVRVDLPKASSASAGDEPARVQVAVLASGELAWEGEIVSRDELKARMREAGLRDQQPEVHLRADRLTPYERVAEVIADAAKAGLPRIAFVTEPEPAAR